MSARCAADARTIESWAWYTGPVVNQVNCPTLITFETWLVRSVSFKRARYYGYCLDRPYRPDYDFDSEMKSLVHLSQVVSVAGCSLNYSGSDADQLVNCSMLQSLEFDWLSRVSVVNGSVNFGAIEQESRHWQECYWRYCSISFDHRPSLSCCRSYYFDFACLTMVEVGAEQHCLDCCLLLCSLRKPFAVSKSQRFDGCLPRMLSSHSFILLQIRYLKL